MEVQVELGAEFDRQMEESGASARSAGGEATVTVDSAGGMTGLRISEHAMRLTANDLALIILDTSRRAQAKMAKQVVDLVNDLYGPDSETAIFVCGAYHRQFPQPPESEDVTGGGTAVQAPIPRRRDQGRRDQEGAGSRASCGR